MKTNSSKVPGFSIRSSSRRRISSSMDSNDCTMINDRTMIGGVSSRRNNKPHIATLKVFIQAFFFCIIFALLTLSLQILRRATASVKTQQDQQRRQQQQQQQQQQLSFTSGNTIPHYVTVVMPSVVNPKDRSLRLAAISQTWGPRAHAVYVVHDMQQYTDSVITDDSNYYPKSLLVPTNISESTMGLERLVFVFNQILLLQQHVDYAFFVNDHTFVIPEHLCHYISTMIHTTYTSTNTQQQQQHHYLYAGHAMKESGEDYMFNSGAAGYILSRLTIIHLLDVIVTKQHDCYSRISPKRVKWYQGNPGLIIAKCLHDALHVDAIDTRHQEEQEKVKKHLFHAFGLVRMVTGKVDEWYINKHRLLPFEQEENEQEKVTKLLPHGSNCCSTFTISFHYVNQDETRALYATRKWIIQKKQNGLSLVDSHTSTQLYFEVEDMVRKLWPSSSDSLGFYSHKLPMDGTEEWKQFLQVLWDISTVPSGQFDKCWSSM